MKTVRIFLSSPGDVAAERAQARELLLGLARGPFVRDRVHVDVVSWDDPHGGATMDARLSPQQAVDRSLPTPAQCDLTIVLLWGRMGTPLAETKADGTPYLSGTEWEFENALAANKPVLVYRRTEKVSLDADDPDVEEKLTQKRRVDAFFERFKGDRGTLLRAHASYTSTDDLVQRLRADMEHHLSELLRDVDGGDSAREERAAPWRSAAIAARPPEVPVVYREWVKKQHGGVDLLGLQLKKGRPPSLSAIYVPQTTTAAASAEPKADDRHWLASTFGERQRHTLALSRLTTESLYVSGAPGTGKSTFCRWVAWLVAEGAMPSLDVPPPDEFTEALDDGLKRRLPILLRLRELWEYLPPRVGASLTVSDLEDAIATWVDKRRPDGLDAVLFRAHLAHGSALLLLDGMDEVPVSAKATAGKWLPRQQLLSALADACPTWGKAGNRLLLTSRPYGLAADQATRMTLGRAPLQPLPDELQQLLARRWFSVLSADAQAGAEAAADLFANIGSQPWLVELASNPLLLTAMCIVFDEGKRLPQDKHELYERVVGTVLYSRYQDPADIDRVKRELGVIAYGMHTGAVPGDERTTPKAEATFHEIERWLQEYQERKGYTERSEAGGFETREALLSHSGLFVGSGDDRAGFAHLSFQEFFAAQRTFTVHEEGLPDVFLQRAGTPEWRNTLSFLFGRLLSASSEPKKALDLLQLRIDAAGESDTGLLLVLADAAHVVTGKGITLQPDLLRRLQDLLLKVMTGPAGVVTRAEAGSALGWLGDPRFRADRLWLPDEDLLGFIPVEAGAFLMGSDPRVDPRAKHNEQPQHSVEVPSYYFSRYPVTIAQFRAFADDTAFKVSNRNSLRGIPNDVVNHVSFAEALRYCEWLTRRLKSAEWTPALLREHLGAGWVITLPTEAQWEKAACGSTGGKYPWADEIKDVGLTPRDRSGKTLGYDDVAYLSFEGGVVGIRSERVSPCGAADMGRFAEWTRGTGHQYPYLTHDGPDDARSPADWLPVVRGFSRATSRLCVGPGAVSLRGLLSVMFRLALTKQPDRAAGNK